MLSGAIATRFLAQSAAFGGWNMAVFIDNPDYWHGRAQQVRAQAKTVHDHCLCDVRTRRELIEIAEAYDRIAQHMREGGD
ncbi:MAG: hypothetical protein ACREFL_08425 [Stellaceae bacterium]